MGRHFECKTCRAEADTLINGECPPCFNTTQSAWEAKMAIRQDAKQFDPDKLIRLLITQHWMHECEIVSGYMPPFPDKTTRPTCVVRYKYKSGTETFLRYSAGPLQGYFWDIYGDDMHFPELALVAIINAPAPPHIGVVIPTHGR